jgi:SAM-dependent methyltransferase
MKRIIALLIRFVPRKYLQLFSGIGLKVVGVFYFGKEVECPICKHHYKKFLPYGRINPRPNALCPHCLSLERHRLIWLFLERETNFFKLQLSVLHIAPEPCFIKPFAKQHGEKYVTGDIESPLAKVKMDIHTMPFEDNQFDVVLCNHVLEHVANDIQAMQEICRVLKPGGWSILQVPFFRPIPEVTIEDPSITDRREREKAFGQDDHVRKYGNDYAKRIERAGMNADENFFSLMLSESDVKKFGIARGEILYRGIKPK